MQQRLEIFQRQLEVIAAAWRADLVARELKPDGIELQGQRQAHTVEVLMRAEAGMRAVRLRRRPADMGAPAAGVRADGQHLLACDVFGVKHGGWFLQDRGRRAGADGPVLKP